MVGAREREQSPALLLALACPHKATTASAGIPSSAQGAGTRHRPYREVGPVGQQPGPVRRDAFLHQAPPHRLGNGRDDAVERPQEPRLPARAARRTPLPETSPSPKAASVSKSWRCSQVRARASAAAAKARPAPSSMSARRRSPPADGTRRPATRPRKAAGREGEEMADAGKAARAFGHIEAVRGRRARPATSSRQSGTPRSSFQLG